MNTVTVRIRTVKFRPFPESCNKKSDNIQQTSVGSDEILCFSDGILQSDRSSWEWSYYANNRRRPRIVQCKSRASLVMWNVQFLWRILDIAAKMWRCIQTFSFSGLLRNNLLDYSSQVETFLVEMTIKENPCHHLFILSLFFDTS